MKKTICVKCKHYMPAKPGPYEAQIGTPREVRCVGDPDVDLCQASPYRLHTDYVTGRKRPIKFATNWANEPMHFAEYTHRTCAEVNTDGVCKKYEAK